MMTRLQFSKPDMEFYDLGFFLYKREMGVGDI